MGGPLLRQWLYLDKKGTVTRREDELGKGCSARPHLGLGLGLSLLLLVMDVMAGSASSDCQQHENEGSRDDDESGRQTATAAIRDGAHCQALKEKGREGWVSAGRGKEAK